ncbi:N-formylglutamate deformylase [Roseibium album]|nr:N-formylglutamate deformylase [Roseibium album]
MILVEEGKSPLILCLPHSGTEVPNVVLGQFNATGRLQADLSWKLEQVFDLHDELEATVLRSTTSRYVIDLDRNSEAETGNGLDPSTTPCPATTLDGKPIYREGERPGPIETEQRALLFFDPFHFRLRQQIDRLLRLHGIVVLLDCQSMRSNIQGVTGKGLPLVSIGSVDGQSCDPDLRNLIVGSFKGQPGYTVGIDEQVTGGFITRTYGRPEQGVHALTVLMAQRSYLRHESPPFEPDKTRVARLKTVLTDSLSRIIDWTGTQKPVEAIELPEEADAQEIVEEILEPETVAEDAAEESLENQTAGDDDQDEVPVEGSTEEAPSVEASETGQEDPEPSADQSAHKKVPEDGETPPLMVAE